MPISLKSLRADASGDEEEEELTQEEEEALSELVSGMLMESSGATWSSHTLVNYGPDTRSVLISGEVTEAVANCVCSQLHALDEMDGELPIQVYINTVGGDVISALALYDTMRAIQAPIITVVQGRAFSAGLLLLQAGDLRIAYPNSKLFYHEPMASGSSNTLHEAIEYQEQYQWARDTQDEIIQKRAKIGKRAWKKYFTDKRTSSTFLVEEALELNLIDDIMAYSKKPKIVLSEEE